MTTVFVFVIALHTKSFLLDFVSWKQRERERKPSECSTSPQEANKLRSQGMSITFDDVTVCIDVSVATVP